MPKYSRTQLEDKTSKELKRMCVYELEIPGMTKKAKDVVISAILEKFGTKTASAPAFIPTAKGGKNPLGQVQGTFTSFLDKPKGKFGNRNTTTIRVSSGASAAKFSVVGETVETVSELLREVLNVDRMSTGLVNGKEVPKDYVLKENDNLEFLKPAGKKG